MRDGGNRGRIVAIGNHGVPIERLVPPSRPVRKISADWGRTGVSVGCL